MCEKTCVATQKNEKVIFLYFTFRNFFFDRSLISGYTAPIFTIFFHQMKDICVHFIDLDLFFRFLKGRCHGNFDFRRVIGR